MSLQDYYDNFVTQPSRWASPKGSECACGGRGLWTCDLDITMECPFHSKPGDFDYDNEPTDQRLDFYSLLATEPPIKTQKARR